MFTFDLQRFDSVIDNDYNLKQGLRNIVVGHMHNIDNNFLHKESLQFSQSDVTDVMSNATLGGSTPAPATGKTIPTMSIFPAYPAEINLTSQDGVNYSYQYDAAYGDVTFTGEYNGDGDIYAFAIQFNGLDEYRLAFGTAAVEQGFHYGSTYHFTFDASTLVGAETIVILATETANFAPKVLLLNTL